MNRFFAIGDIHGCHKTLNKLLFEVIDIKVTDEIYCVGDYIDRGPDSKGVIDLILFLNNQGFKIHTLRGNHEQMMLDAFNGGAPYYKWLANGGDATMNSFKVNSMQDIDSQYYNFLQQTLYYIEIQDYILVHAALNFTNDNLFEDKEAMLWERDIKIDKQKLNGRIMVHGHTPEPFNIIMSQLNQPDISVIDIDGGCVYKGKPGMGNLFALDFAGKKLISVDNID